MGINYIVNGGSGHNISSLYMFLSFTCFHIINLNGSKLVKVPLYLLFKQSSERKTSIENLENKEHS